MQQSQAFAVPHMQCGSLSIHWSVYFDDFMVVEDACLAKHTNFIIDGLFSLLGWETSKEKGCAFDPIARALGVVFDMSDTKLLSIKVLNAPHRCKEIGEHLDRILQSGESSRSQLEVVRGRLIFDESHIYGRNAHSALRVLSRHIHGSPFVKVDEALSKALIFLRDRVLVSQCKVVSCQYKAVRHIYTDACFETRLAGLGGVAYDMMATLCLLASSAIRWMQASLNRSSNPAKRMSSLLNLKLWP